ncbi:putative major fimbrial protein SthE [Ralstonia mannitolilytica]|uniref:Major fimbrial protein SthE n=1 Tax=Ralstonia mannitolilytica TaxID=105219 RepID=A0AAJ5D374_9RALS|nr:Fimbria adhesin protein [Ralstonia mannitolilytica]CAJ0728820.1 Fimbria adhesin protein [Ralstonia mannitolilytica]SUD89393.1 putative major fimbrial protein SthE [Ralstonia mannitolilytica]SUD95318.1 putative major fimbrial protein SthE [Ralstonia mannitolilytica]SUD95772.1 putative major fimbrial protein SthE [Ralstonia mannitolilytica]
MRVWCARLAASLLCIGAKSAFAYSCQTVTSDTLLQPKAMSVQRDLPVGSVIAEVVSDVKSTFRCTNSEPRLSFQETGVKAFGTYVGDFDGKRVYSTNIEGIGYAVAGTPISQCAGKTYWVDGIETTNVDHNVYCKVNGMFGVQPMTAKAVVRFYKTAATTGTGTITARQVGSFILKNDKSTWFTPEAKISISAFDVSSVSCTLGSTAINVKMGDVPVGAFKGVGTWPDSARTKAFDIPLTCSQGASINLKLDGTAYDTTKGMLKLDEATNPAKGVAIQLLYDNQPVELAKSFKWQTASEDGTYAIPLKARYVQTDSNITPGAANGSATFTLTYQ